MQKLVLLLIATVIIFDYLIKSLGISNKFSIFPEFLSFIAFIMIAGRLGFVKVLEIKSKYIIFFFISGLYLTANLIINYVPSGGALAGLRIYLKYIPFFLIPAIYPFTESEIKKQFILLLALSLIQLPLTLFQRFVQYKDLVTGDVITGTLGVSSILSIYLICGIAMIMAFYINKKITLKVFYITVFLLFLPTTLNETKGTLVLLPLAIFLPLLFTSEIKNKAKMIWSFAIITTMFFAIFVLVYDYFMAERYNRSLVDFITDPTKVGEYLAPQASGIQKEDRIGKIDKVIIPLQMLYDDDPLRLITGLGVGNVTKSPISSLQGEYINYTDEGLVGGGMSYLLWETGLIGVALSIIFFINIYFDARYVNMRGGFQGVVALGWIPIVVIIFLSMFYKNIIHVNAIGYLFWFYSGYIVSSRVRIEKTLQNDINSSMKNDFSNYNYKTIKL